MSENTNDSTNPVLTFEGKKYLINELSNEIKESIKILQIAETQLKMHQDTLKLLSISPVSYTHLTLPTKRSV